MSVSIEFYNPSHQSAIEALILGIQRVEYRIDIDIQRQSDLRDIQGFYQINNGNFWVAMMDNKLVGTIALLDIGHNQGALRKMFVHENYRGKLYSVATSLLIHLEQWALQKGISQIFLGTTVHFIAAHRFYGKNGFDRLDKNELPSSFPIMEVDTMFFKKRL